MSLNDDESLNFFEARADEVLRSRITAFRRLMFGTFTVALSVFYFLVLPYVSSHTARSELLRESSRLKDEIERTRLVADHHDELADRLGDGGSEAFRMRRELIAAGFHLGLRDRAEEQRAKVTEWRRELRAWIDEEPGAAAWVSGETHRPTLSNSFYHGNPRFQQQFNDPCFWLDADLWTLCQIGESLSAGHNHLRNSLGFTDADLSRGFEMRALRAALDTIVAPFERWATDPDPAVLDDFDSVRQLLSRELEDYAQVIVDALGRVRRVRAEIATDLTASESALAGTVERIERAEARLERARTLETIETPVGDLPIGLDDLVLLFPAVLMAVVYYLLTQLEHSVGLRRAVHRSLTRRNQSLPAEPNEYLRMTSSLWLEPLDQRPRQIVQLVVLALPLITAVVAVCLVVDKDFLFSEMVVPSVTMRVSYLIGYLATLSFVAVAAMRLFAMSERYRAWADSPHSLDQAGCP